MRIGLNNFFYKNIKKQQYAHTKSVARLVNSENLSKKKIYIYILLHAHTKSVARLVDSKNLSKKYIYIYILFLLYFFFKHQHAHTNSVARLVDSENKSIFFLQKNNTRKQKVLLY